ncbi:MAG: hypothetical protein IKR10_09310, partial [Firmicutes bacterium]|nr:hypothetical protein [Bacillota bacterium]
QVDRETLTILSLKTPDERYEVVCGENAAPFSSVYAQAMTDSRTITCHYLTAGETKDIVWQIPSAWEAEVVLAVYVDGASPFFSSSAEMNQPCSNVIPAYSGDVEIWCTLAMG